VPSAPPRGDAFAEPVPLLREAPGARLASRNLAGGLARPPRTRGACVADREVQGVKAAVLVGGLERPPASIRALADLPALATGFPTCK
jgi:hypothetical protein